MKEHNMSLWKKILDSFKTVEDRAYEESLKKEKKPKKPRKPKSTKSAKELATEKDEPYITVVTVDLDKRNLGNGSFELDWNDAFIKQLRNAGYPGKTDEDVVDNWFREVCKNVYNETWEQDQAQKTAPDNVRYINRTFTSDGRTEVS